MGRPGTSRARERRWIVLASDGRHVSVGRDTDPSPDDLERAGAQLGALGLGGWLAVMEGDYHAPRSGMRIMMVRQLTESAAADWDAAVAAFRALRERTQGRSRRIPDVMARQGGTRMGEVGEIRVNRAPVLTLWATVVAERLGHDPDTALTLGRTVAGSSARAKARAIGLEEGDRDEDLAREAADAAHTEHGRAVPQAKTVRLLGRDVPVIETKQGLRALEHGHAASPGPARAYVERAFGAHLPAVRRAMEHLAASLDPEALNRVGFRLYERFRPAVPEGARGWGAKGALDLRRIEDAHR